VQVKLRLQPAVYFDFAGTTDLGDGGIVAAVLGADLAGSLGAGAGGGSFRSLVSRSRNICVRSDPIRRSIAQALSTQLAIRNHVILLFSPSVSYRHDVYIGVLCFWRAINVEKILFNGQIFGVARF